MKKLIYIAVTAAVAGLFLSEGLTQPPGRFGPGGFGPGGFGPGGPGRGGPGGPRREERKILKQFDKDENEWLDETERAIARKEVQAQQTSGGGRAFGGRGGPGRGRPGRGRPGAEQATPKAGPQIATGDVEVYPDKALYDTSIMRTLFLEFENDDWEVELEDFHGTDVDVAATLIVDGKTYPQVGVHFRGMSSYDHVPRGRKRSFNVSLDMANEDQRLYGYKTLNLLNCNGDPSMMSTVVYSHIANQYIPTPKANFVQVVVNGESWGSFVNVQQFDKTFAREAFGKSKGTRWKASGSPNADGGLRYLGDDLQEYKQRFEMKSNDGNKAWTALVELCRTLNETPTEDLQAALEPMLDIDGTLKFLALDNALVNSDGYWTRASDYGLFLDASGKFHLVPHDMNEAFALSRRGPGGPGGFGPPPGRGQGGGRRGFGPPPGEGGDGGFRPRGPEGFGPPPGQPQDGFRPQPGQQPNGDGRPPQGERDRQFGPRGPGGFGPRGPGGLGQRGPGGPGHGGVDLEPLVDIDNERMPLRSRLLAVPELRERYLEYVKAIATNSLDWQELGPVVDGYRGLISPVVKQDTRMSNSFEAFNQATRSDRIDEQPMSLHKFAVERRKFLLDPKGE